MNEDDIQTLIRHQLNLTMRKNKSKFINIFDEEVNLYREDIIFRAIIDYYNDLYTYSGLLCEPVLNVFYDDYSKYNNFAGEIYLSLRDKKLV